MTIQDITQLLSQWRQGDQQAHAQLLQQLYPMLRALANKNMRAIGGHFTVCPTEIAHEAVLRLSEQENVNWQSRAHCMATVASMVRHVVIDYLRERGAEKRHGGKVVVQWQAELDHENSVSLDAAGWIAVNEALLQLEALDADCARVVELKLFSDLGAEAIAEVCDFSVATVGRHWRFAKVWLAQQLRD